MKHILLPFISLFIITYSFLIESPFSTSSQFDRKTYNLSTGTKGSFIDNEDSLIFNQVFSPEEMQEDIEYFFNKLEKVHVNPYAFFSMDSIEQRKDELLKSLNKPLTRYKFNRIASSLNSLFDGHTRIEWFDGDYFMNYYTHDGRFIPYNLKYEKGKIRFNPSQDSLKTLQIKAINKIPIDSICLEIEKRFNSENRNLRNFIIESNIHFILYTIFDIQSPYVLEVVDTIKKVSYKLKFDGVTSDEIIKPIKLNNQTNSARIYPEDSIAIIEHNTCVYNENTPELRKFNYYIDSVFQVINTADIKHLFIDISRNGGGSSFANNVFYENINHEPNPWEELQIRKVSQESKLQLTGLSVYYSNDPLEERLKSYRAKVESGDLTGFQRSFINLKNGHLNKHTYSHNTSGLTDGYKNNIYLIQSYRTYSAAMNMAAWFKYGRVGKIIGSETGGTTEVYIESILFYMPNSKIAFRIADQYEKYPNGSLNNGIEPDIDLGDNFYKEEFDLDDLKKFIERIQINK